MVRVKTENAPVGVLVWQLAVVLSRFRIMWCSGVALMGLTSAVAQDTIQVQYRYADGTISSEGQLVNGVPEGYWISFYPEGTRKSEGNWRQGKIGRGVGVL